MEKRSKQLLANGFSRAIAKTQGATKRKSQQAVVTSAVVPGSTKLARNAECPCGSGKKLKKCCGAAAATKTVTDMAEVFMAATKGIPQTAAAMLRAGEESAIVYAYYQTADYICEDNRDSKSPEQLAIWDAHVTEFSSADAETQQRIIDDITTVKES